MNNYIAPLNIDTKLTATNQYLQTQNIKTIMIDIEHLKFQTCRTPMYLET